MDLYGVEIQSQVGKCISSNVIYLASCSICNKGYVGETTNFLRTRINGHRAVYYKILVANGILYEHNNDFENDLSLSHHLFKSHNCVQRADFNEFLKFTIIQHCSPETIDSSEHRWIHRLKTLEPGGINSVNPFGIAIL